MPCSAAILVLVLICFATGTIAAFTAQGSGSTQVPPITTTATVGATLIMDGPTASKAAIAITLSNIKDYIFTTLQWKDPSSKYMATILFVDPARSSGFDSDNPLAKTINGSVTFTGQINANYLAGPVGALSKDKRMAQFWTDLWAGQVYLAVCTLQKSSGYLVQKLVLAPEVYYAYLDGSHSIPPVTTTATGYSVLTISPDYLTATVMLAITNVMGEFMSHIHQGNSTTNGPPILWINPLSPNLLTPGPQYVDIGSVQYTVAFNATDLSTSYNSSSLVLLAQLARKSGIYANVHSKAYPGGIIRSQYSGYYPMVNS